MEFEHDVFLSFSNQDEEIAGIIWQVLSTSGLRVFWSDEALKRRHGDAWFGVIETALERSKHFILIVSSAALLSKWVKFEYESFLDRYQESGSRLLIPMLRDNFKASSLPLFLGRLEACMLNQKDSLRLLLPRLGGKNELDPLTWELLTKWLVREEAIKNVSARAEELQGELRKIQEEDALWRINMPEVHEPQAKDHLEEIVRQTNKIASKTH